jgi:hypothetical protein
MKNLYHIDYSIKISIYVMYYICVHCFLTDPRNISAGTYIVVTTLEKMLLYKKLRSRPIEHRISFKNLFQN